MAPSSFFSDSPTVLLQPQHAPDQYFQESHYQPVRNAQSSGFPTPSEAMNGLSMSSQPPTPSAGCIAGRKRSRNDIYSNDDEIVDGSVTTQAEPQINRGDPVYGPGMTLIYPNDPSGHYSPDAASQTGTWLEQRAEESVNAQPKRPIIASRKSQRMCSSVEGRADSPTAVSEPVPRAPGSEPLIDEASRLLGVSWKRMDQTEALQIAQRAYTRWIQRHYQILSNVELWFENSAIPGYLGKAFNKSSGVEEFYLWSYDLHQAILITRQPNDLVLKLSQPLMSLSQATESIRADLEPVVEASAANAAILRNDRFLIDNDTTAGSEMDVD